MPSHAINTSPPRLASKVPIADSHSAVETVSGNPGGVGALCPFPSIAEMDDDALIDRLQGAAFDYFLLNRIPATGLFADTSRAGSPVSIAVVGFALSSYPVAVERGWTAREIALAHCLQALRFFRDSDQTGTPESTGYKGFYFHFLDRDAGTRVWRCELSMIDTALLMAGALAARQYFDADVPEETELREIVDLLYRRVDWNWSQNGCGTIMQGWKPECGFLHYGWEGYNEAIVLYVLALGSPTYPIRSDCYDAWTATYQWENLYGHDFLLGGPLFIHQFSHAWIDFRGIRDPFMQAKGCDYFENSQRAVHVQRAYCCINPRGHTGYGANGWGLSACEGPSDEIQGLDGEPRHLYGYAARSVPYGPDDGTLSAPAVLASLPFAPALVLDAVRDMVVRYPETLHEGAFASGFNPGLASADGRPWVSPGLFGLDQGIIVMMLENQRSGKLWSLMRNCPYIVDGLRRAGFAGGWLSTGTPGKESS